jgi:hypothetical protein
MGGPDPIDITTGFPGTWAFVEKGTTVVPNGSGDLTVSTPYTLGAGELLVALVSIDGATAGLNLMNDNTNINPGVNDIHWNIRSAAGALALHLRSGNSGGSTVRWAIYTVVPP